jgi:hypothetical protein
MMRPTSARLLALAASVGALALPGCGGDDEGQPIPADQVTALERQLSSIESRFEFGDGACKDIDDGNVPAVGQILDQVPSSVGQDVRDALRQSFDRLFELTGSQCEEDKGQRTTSTETTPTETATTETTPTETATTESTPTETEQEAPGQKKKKDKEESGSIGNGGGGGTAAPEGG